MPIPKNSGGRTFCWRASVSSRSAFASSSFPVSVDHALVVCMLHGIAHARKELEASGQTEASAVGEARQTLAFDQLHGEEGLLPHRPFGDAHLVDLGDARMLQARQHFGLVLEPSQQLRRREARPHELESHLAAGPLLLRSIDGPHAPFAQQIDDAEPTDEGPRRQPLSARRFLPRRDSGRVLEIAGRARFVHGRQWSRHQESYGKPWPLTGAGSSHERPSVPDDRCRHGEAKGAPNRHLDAASSPSSSWRDADVSDVPTIAAHPSPPSSTRQSPR